MNHKLTDHVKISNLRKKSKLGQFVDVVKSIDLVNLFTFFKNLFLDFLSYTKKPIHTTSPQSLKICKYLKKL